jgi:hypothetical protein
MNSHRLRRDLASWRARSSDAVSDREQLGDLVHEHRGDDGEQADERARYEKRQQGNRKVSPTEAMPLSRWAKLLMLAESALSSVTVLLVAARAVNIFK